jgi:hypothetical protein
MIVPPLRNMYGKLSTVVVFDVPKILSGDEHRSTSAILFAQNFFDALNYSLVVLTCFAV